MGQQFSARVLQAIVDKDYELKKEMQQIKFLCESDGDTADEILSYNQMLDYK
jgi:hypothetical protein